MIDTEIANKSNGCFEPGIPSEDYELKMAPVLMQGIAALEPATFAEVVMAITELKSIKITKQMSLNEEADFIAHRSSFIYEENFNYQFIKAGIHKIIKDPNIDKWFPDIPIIIKYIEYEHRLLKNRMTMLHDLLLRRRKLFQLENKNDLNSN